MSSSALVSGVFCLFSTRFECSFSVLVTLPLDVISDIVMFVATVGAADFNAFCKTTLETSGEDVKLHSKRVEKM